MRASSPMYKHNSLYLGSTNYDLKHQAERLVEKLVNGKKYDFYNTWKVVTLFIGGNDLCACCRKLEKYKPDKFIKGMIFRLSPLIKTLNKGTLICTSLFHKIYSVWFVFVTKITSTYNFYQALLH